MFYNVAATQEKFELLVFLVLLMNLLVFLTITYKPSIFRNMSTWATRLVDRLFKGIFSKHHH